MEAKLEKLTQRFGVEIRTMLKKANLYDNNIDFRFNYGRYEIAFSREHGKLEVLTQYPLEFYELISRYLKAMDELWKEEDNDEECFADHTNGEYTASLFIDGNPYTLSTVLEINSNILVLNSRLIECISEEKFEEAARIQKLLNKREQELEKLNKPNK